MVDPSVGGATSDTVVVVQCSRGLCSEVLDLSVHRVRSVGKPIPADCCVGCRPAGSTSGRQPAKGIKLCELGHECYGG